MSCTHIPLIVIAGPTAVGKTALSIELAQHFGGEVINGDSLQIYRGLDIGTGKITADEMADVPHHLLDIVDVDAVYDASQFKQMATTIIQAIHARGKLPILVGGTGLYLEGLLYDLEFGGDDSHDAQVRARLYDSLQTEGAQALWQKLFEQDPQAAQHIPYQNHRRVIRALEVIEVSGQLFSEQMSHHIQQDVFHTCLFVLDRPREALYNRINVRVLSMVETGLEKEAYALYERAQRHDWQSTKGIGYKEWWPYFDGECSREAAIAQIQQNSRRYAKRQLTWFRNRFKRTHWLDMTNEQAALQQAIHLITQHLGGQQHD